MKRHRKQLSRPESLYWNPCHTYVLLSKNLSQSEFDARLPKLVEKHYPDYLKNTQSFYTQPLLDIHLRSDLGEEIEPQGNILYVNIFSAIAVFIILLACINFMNLSTSRSVNRAKEIGVRKALGAAQQKLILEKTLVLVTDQWRHSRIAEKTNRCDLFFEFCSQQGCDAKR